MTNEEFSNAFDVLLNSYKHTGGFGEESSLFDLTLDEYEKSIFLTQAQDIIVRKYFSNTLNQEGEGFDDSSKRQLDFSSLIHVESISSLTENVDGSKGYAPKSYIADLSTLQALFIINERLVIGSKNRVVVPISYDEYDRQMSKAYPEPLKRQAWRLFNQTSGKVLSAELIVRSDDNKPSKYIIRYVKRPTPIVLIDLNDTINGLSIDGITNISPCELNPVVHQEILHEAVRLALSANGIETRDMQMVRNQQNK